MEQKNIKQEIENWLNQNGLEETTLLKANDEFVLFLESFEIDKNEIKNAITQCSSAFARNDIENFVGCLSKKFSNNNDENILN